MSIEPVTVTTKHNTDIFDLADHQRLAAERMGLESAEIHCTGTGPDGIEVVQEENWSSALFSQDGTVLKPAELIQPRVLRYIRKTTWEEIPKAVGAAPAAPPAEMVDLNWPDMKLPRGARWSGRVIIDDIDAERAFISTGTEMVLVSSPEGFAVMKALEAEVVAEQSTTGG